MGKKKFIDKKKSATFKLLARDTSTFPSSAEAPPISDRVFVRVDDNPYSPHGFQDLDPDDCGVVQDQSIFADAPGDTDDEKDFGVSPVGGGGGGALPDHVRKQILELGLPDDGYNYLIHLREIKNMGGGSSYYQNSKARLDLVPLDIKAYDASRLRISGETGEESNGNDIYKIAAKTVGMRVQKALDPDVVRLLDDGDLSRFGSDVEDLEEDFVLKANLPEEGEDGELEVEHEWKVFRREDGSARDVTLRGREDEIFEDDEEEEIGGGDKPRPRRLLDEQFDLLTLQEYDNESDSDDGHANIDAEPLAAKLNDALKGHEIDDSELDDKYTAPGDFLLGDKEPGSSKQLNDSAYVIRKCVEYAERYFNESEENDEVVIMEESSDESEVWDCETIISTYSTLDNHPGKIQAPENPKKKILKNLSVDAMPKSNVIVLRGKEKLPIDFLPDKQRTAGKVKKPAGSGVEKPKRRPHGEESKEEKKERKAAVKQEKREARQAKKELKGLYKCETQKAQKIAAISVPSAIHLM